MVRVVSAGTWARHGSRCSRSPQSRTLAERGVDCRRIRGDPAQRDRSSRSADLVLTATREHRSAVVGMAPSAVRRTFTLLELARIAVAAAPAGRDRHRSGQPSATVRQAVAWAAQMRGVDARHGRQALTISTTRSEHHRTIYRARADTDRSCRGADRSLS